MINFMPKSFSGRINFYLFYTTFFYFTLTSISCANYTGNDLLRACDNKEALNGECSGYIAGIIDATYFNMLTKSEILKSNNICVPENVTVDQISKVIIKYSNDNPSELHHDAFSIVLNALEDYFPCRGDTAIEKAKNKIISLYHKSQYILCEKNPSPHSCPYVCSSLSPDGESLMCSYIGGGTPSFYKKIQNSN